MLALVKCNNCKICQYVSNDAIKVCAIIYCENCMSEIELTESSIIKRFGDTNEKVKNLLDTINNSTFFAKTVTEEIGKNMWFYKTIIGNFNN